MKYLIAAMAIAFATPVAAQVVAATPRGVVVAHDGVVELFDDRARRIWSAPGVDHATKIVTGRGRIAVLDAWANRARLIDLRDGSGKTIVTGETPVDGVFVDQVLYVLERDASRLAAVESRHVVAVAADPIFVRESEGKLYVYSRREGVLQEIERGAVTRSAVIAPFASDFEIHGRTAYFLLPRDARLVSVDLEQLAVRSSVAAGGVPVDLAITGGGTALTAVRLAVADPAAKRLWITEGTQSFGAAFGRGFLRGLLGLGLFRPRSSEFPTGIDRVMSAGGVTLTFDSATGTLYRVGGGKSIAVAEGIAAEAVTVMGNRVVFWRDGALRFAD